jgi:hypothetical protein
MRIVYAHDDRSAIWQEGGEGLLGRVHHH